VVRRGSTGEREKGRGRHRRRGEGEHTVFFETTERINFTVTDAPTNQKAPFLIFSCVYLSLPPFSCDHA
jgi:hypothetical protein